MKITDGLRSWIVVILLERYGVDFEVDLQDDRWVMTLPHLAGCIEVMRSNTCFSPPVRLIPCAWWDARDFSFYGAVGSTLAAPGAVTLAEPLVTTIDRGFNIAYDLFSLAAWAMTRQEEIGSSLLDEHDRFPATESHAYRHGYLERPVVDEWFSVLRCLIRRVWPTLPLKEDIFAQAVSHDVDEPSFAAFATPTRLLRRMLGDAVGRRKLRSLIDLPRIRLESRLRISPRDPLNTFDWLMAGSERRGLKSAFYFICGRTDPARDGLYEVEHPAIRELLRRIHARGHEIGLHPSYGTFRSPELIAGEAARLRRVCADEGIEQAAWGGRMHYLRWENPTTLYGWERAGMAYDSTLGYADQPGFRCGTCFEYPAFDIARDEMLALRIRPLVAMDQTFLGKHYLNLGSGDEALARFSALKNACRRVGGVFTLLWHNSFFPTDAERRLYEQVLDA